VKWKRGLGAKGLGEKLRLVKEEGGFGEKNGAMINCKKL